MKFCKASFDMGHWRRMNKGNAYHSHYNVFSCAIRIVAECVMHDKSWEETEDLLESLHCAFKALDKAWA